jgi:hypothetical protein
MHSTSVGRRLFSGADGTVTGPWNGVHMSYGPSHIEKAISTHRIWIRRHRRWKEANRERLAHEIQASTAQPSSYLLRSRRGSIAVAACAQGGHRECVTVRLPAKALLFGSQVPSRPAPPCGPEDASLYFGVESRRRQAVFQLDSIVSESMRPSERVT